MEAETPESIIRPYLGSKERLVWTGRPAQGLRLAPSDALMIPFSLVWAGIVFWNFGIGFRGLQAAPLPFMLFECVFLLFGVYFVLGRFLVDAWARSRTVYGLTGQRAIIVRRLWGEQLLTSPLDRSIRLKRRGRGGDIEFGYRPGGLSGMRGQGLGTWNPALTNQVTFLGLPDAMEVYRKAQAAAEKSETVA